ncbi:MAG: response regulator transcription factor [Sandaracinus sp.]|nr:response regulator transcription factor [Sandaracinus sp.]MCB9625206.1 response regulator transcription factor [Sandaracinus sp.]MCB9633815.1 response regulator transcription factor [Sandaracinus sp.]
MNRIALERMGGHHVDEAVGVREALELAGRSEYDLVLLDAMMPDGTGMELSAELRRRRPRLRLVILSAAQEEQLAPEGHAADAWWQKPLSPKRLVELVDALGDEV